MFRLAHQDRSGIYVTPLFDIHKDASLFVQFIVGLMSPNEETLGLDTSVQWTIDEASGKKVSGTITLEEAGDQAGTSTAKTHDLDMDEAPFVRPGIRGRGTVIWHAIHLATNHAVLIKDSWRTEGRTSEAEHLRTARGIPGIVETVAYQDNCAKTSEYRPEPFEAEDFANRVKLRIVLKGYGRSIWHFKTRFGLLCAL